MEAGTFEVGQTLFVMPTDVQCKIAQIDIDDTAGICYFILYLSFFFDKKKSDTKKKG